MANAEAHQLRQRRRILNEFLDLIIYCHLLLAIEPFKLSLDRIKRLESQFAQIDGLDIVLAFLLAESSERVQSVWGPADLLSLLVFPLDQRIVDECLQDAH